MKSDSSPKGTLRLEIIRHAVADSIYQPWKQQHVPASNREREVHQDIMLKGYREEYPILVSSRDPRVVLDGWVRLEGAKKKGLSDIPAIVVPCTNEQDEIEVIVRSVLKTRMLTTAQYQLLCFEYGQTLSQKAIAVRNSKNAKKKSKKTQPENASDTLPPEPVAEHQADQDSRKVACQMFGVKEWDFKTLQALKKKAGEDWPRQAQQIREGKATAKGLLEKAKDVQNQKDRNDRKEAAAKLPEIEGWRQGMTATVLKSLPEGTTFRLIIVKNQYSLGDIPSYLATDGHLLMAVENWRNLHAAQEALDKLNCHVELLAVSFPKESSPKNRIQGEVCFALLASRRDDLQERISRVFTAGSDEMVMPTEHMVQVLAKAVTVANERILITDGTTKEYILLTRLCRRPLVIAGTPEEYDAGLVEISEELPKPAPALQCLISPETLPPSPGDSSQTSPDIEPADTAVPAATDESAPPAVPPMTTTPTNEEVA
jgi:hypothetical protein